MHSMTVLLLQEVFIFVWFILSAIKSATHILCAINVQPLLLSRLTTVFTTTVKYLNENVQFVNAQYGDVVKDRVA